MGKNQYRQTSPCVDIRYSPLTNLLVLSARRWDSRGLHEFVDGSFLCDRVDGILQLPQDADAIGREIKTALMRSKQVRSPTDLPARFVDQFSANKKVPYDFYPFSVWTENDKVTSFHLVAARSVEVDLAGIEIPNGATNADLGVAVLSLIQDIERLVRS